MSVGLSDTVGDAYSTIQLERNHIKSIGRDCRLEGPIQASPVQHPPRETERQVEEYVVPTDCLDTHYGIAYVLNQQQDRMRITDIKAAIEVKKVQLAEQKNELERVMKSCNVLDALDDPAVSKQVKAELFDLRLSENQLQQVTCKKMCCVQPGIQPPTQSDIETYQNARNEAWQIEIQKEHQKSLQRYCVKLGGEALCHRGQDGKFEYDGMEAFVPDWNLLKFDDWKKKVYAFQQFQWAVTRVMFRNRAERRLKFIRKIVSHIKISRKRSSQESTVHSQNKEVEVQLKRDSQKERQQTQQ